MQTYNKIGLRESLEQLETVLTTDAQKQELQQLTAKETEND